MPQYMLPLGMESTLKLCSLPRLSERDNEASPCCRQRPSNQGAIVTVVTVAWLSTAEYSQGVHPHGQPLPTSALR